MTTRTKLVFRLITLVAIVSLFVPAALGLTGWKTVGQGYAKSSDGKFSNFVQVHATTKKNPQEFRIRIDSKTGQWGGSTSYSVTANCYDDKGGSISITLSGTKAKDGAFNVKPFSNANVRSMDYCRATVWVSNTWVSTQGRYGSYDPLVKIQAKHK